MTGAVVGERPFCVTLLGWLVPIRTYTVELANRLQIAVCFQIAKLTLNGCFDHLTVTDRAKFKEELHA